VQTVSGVDETVQDYPQMPELETATPEISFEEAEILHKDLSECMFVDSAFEGLPGMDVYREAIASDAEGAQSGAEDADEDQSEASDEDTLVSLTSLISATKKLSLKNEQKSSSIVNNHRRNRGEVRERFIGRNSDNTSESKRTNTTRTDSTRQSFSEMEESDMGRPSEVILSNFPLFPEYESGKDGSHEETECCFTPTQTIREQQEEETKQEGKKRRKGRRRSVFL
jgi:hypothetical protein